MTAADQIRRSTQPVRIAGLYPFLPFVALQADRALMNEWRKLGRRRGAGNGGYWVNRVER
jgi:hypothetical protein